MSEFSQRIYQMEGELSVLNKEFDDLQVLANNSIITIRNKLDAMNIENDFLDLDVEGAYLEMKQLRAAASDAKAKKKKIGKIAGELASIKTALPGD